MAAYVIVDIEVHDPVRYARYREMATPTVAAFGGRYLVRGGKVSILEGAWPTSRFVVLEFPTAEQARAWWDSDLYRPAKALRHETATTKMILVEGA
jgi:uncharacterized protein (DUF1330 family)